MYTDLTTSSAWTQNLIQKLSELAFLPECIASLETLFTNPKEFPLCKYVEGVTNGAITHLLTVECSILISDCRSDSEEGGKTYLWTLETVGASWSTLAGGINELNLSHLGWLLDNEQFWSNTTSRIFKIREMTSIFPVRHVLSEYHEKVGFPSSQGDWLIYSTSKDPKVPIECGVSEYASKRIRRFTDGKGHDGILLIANRQLLLYSNEPLPCVRQNQRHVCKGIQNLTD